MSTVLTLNAGSSSIKFSLFRAEDMGEEARGMVEEIGGRSRLILSVGEVSTIEDYAAPTHGEAAKAILDALAPRLAGRNVSGVGHRVVHGGPDRTAPCIVTPEVLAELVPLEPLAPLHQPFNLAGLRGAMEAFPGVPQVACFDTAFHRAKPYLNDIYALPRPYRDKLRRFGFHGLSYTHIAEVLAQEEPALHAGKVIVLHLGNGASACAMEGGRSIATTMGFSALDGLCMGTRPGALDPGVMLYLMREEGMDAPALERLLYKQSGLKGLSGLSNDMRALSEAKTGEARLAIDYFCARIGREIGALAATMGGLDGIVFTGGIGENAARVRAKALAPLGFLGLAVDADANGQGARSIGAGRLPVLVLPTDEERVIARATVGLCA